MLEDASYIYVASGLPGKVLASIIAFHFRSFCVLVVWHDWFVIYFSS